MAKVFWITGLSGAGKTTIGKKLYEVIKKNDNATVLLDGDELRNVFGSDLGYSKEDRLISATRNSRLCYMLVKQNITVICCTISMFDEIRKWNRENIENYYEIFLDVSLDILKERNQKNLYSNNQKNVAGITFDVEFPKNPDITIKNDGQKKLDDIIELIMNHLKEMEL